MEIAQLREQIDQQLVDHFKRRRPDDPAVHLRKTLVDELIQLDEEGRDIEDVRAEVEAADVLSMDAATAEAYLARLEDAPPRPDFPFEEPSDLAGIQAARPASRPVPPADDDDYERRLRGAWVGRCAGCTLGKPVEGWSRAEIRELLDAADIGDLRFYVPVPGSEPHRVAPGIPRRCTRHLGVSTACRATTTSTTACWRSRFSRRTGPT